MLLDAEASPNIRGEKDCTALQAACRKNKFESVHILMKYKASADICGGRFGSALQAACSAHGTEIIRLLIEAGVDPNPCE